MGRYSCLFIICVTVAVVAADIIVVSLVTAADVAVAAADAVTETQLRYENCITYDANNSNIKENGRNNTKRLGSGYLYVVSNT